MSGNEEDFVRLKQQQVSDHISQPYGSEQRRLFQEGSTADALGTGADGQMERFESVGMETTIDEEIPKSYLPQTVRQGGYMPQ